MIRRVDPNQIESALIALAQPSIQKAASRLPYLPQWLKVKEK
jgi:hypothetical protein